MIKELWHKLDITFGLTERGRQIKQKNLLYEICGDFAKILVVRGIKIEFAHIKQECKSGKPPFAVDTRCVIGALGYDDNFRMYRAVYSPVHDGWLVHMDAEIVAMSPDHFPLVPRRETHYWMDEIDFPVAIENAYIRAVQSRSASTDS